MVYKSLFCCVFRSSCKNQKQQEKPCQNSFLSKPKVVGHINGRDRIPAMAHHNKGFFSGGKQLLLRERAAQTVDCISFRPGKLPAENTHAAALIAGTDKAGVVDIALVGG